MATYPLQTAFRVFLQQEGLAKITIHNYDQTISQLFSFLAANHNEGPIDINTVTTNNLRQYVDYLRAHKRLNDRTYNKLLSQLNRYFQFLFTHGASNQLPTLPLHGQAQEKKTAASQEWLNKLDLILKDDAVHPYTRLTLLLCAHGYTSQEFLQAGFYREFQQLDLKTEPERQFKQSFTSFIQPLQARQKCHDLFLKHRYDPDHPRLTAPALHKYLQHDRSYLGFNVNPQALHRSYILTFLQSHPDDSDNRLMSTLRLDPSSLLYYRRLLLKQAAYDHEN